MEGISVLILFGFIGGVVRGLVGISKSLANHKKIKIGYFVSMVFISGVVGGLASTIIGVDYRFSLLIGYAGADILEALYKAKIGKIV